MSENKEYAIRLIRNGSMEEITCDLCGVVACVGFGDLNAYHVCNSCYEKERKV